LYLLWGRPTNEQNLNFYKNQPNSRIQCLQNTFLLCKYLKNINVHISLLEKYHITKEFFSLYFYITKMEFDFFLNLNLKCWLGLHNKKFSRLVMKKRYEKVKFWKIFLQVQIGVTLLSKGHSSKKQPKLLHCEGWMMIVHRNFKFIKSYWFKNCNTIDKEKY